MAMKGALSPSQICEYDFSSIVISSTERQFLVEDLQGYDESKDKT